MQGLEDRHEVVPARSAEVGGVGDGKPHAISYAGPFAFLRAALMASRSRSTPSTLMLGYACAIAMPALPVPQLPLGGSSACGQLRRGGRTAFCQVPIQPEAFTKIDGEPHQAGPHQARGGARPPGSRWPAQVAQDSITDVGAGVDLCRGLMQFVPGTWLRWVSLRRRRPGRHSA
jgi:hypothetical protein